MRLKNYLTEKMILINNKDLDLIWKPLSKLSKLFSKCIKTPTQECAKNIKKSISPYEIPSTEYVFKKIPSSELTSRKAKLSHKLNPIMINVGIFRSSNYNVINNTLNIGFGLNPVNIIINDPEEIKRVLYGPQGKHFQIEFEEQRIKAVANHEISHWIDDTLHNFHIKRVVFKAKELKKPSIKIKGKSDAYLTDYEINATIHSIKIYKKYNKDIWDLITFDEMLEFMPSEGNMHRRLGKEWRLKIKKRMAREGLLGKYMR